MPRSRSREGTRGRSSQQLATTINRSYDVEYSDTRPIIELKLRSAGPVLRTEMTREAPVTIVLPFFCQFNYVYALNYPLRLEWARLTQKRARTARAAVGPNPSLACPRPRFEVRKRPFLPASDRRRTPPGSDDRRKPRPRPRPVRERVVLIIALGRRAAVWCGWGTTTWTRTTTVIPLRAVKHLVEKHSFNIHGRTRFGKTALDKAEAHGRTECAAVLRGYDAKNGEPAEISGDGDIYYDYDSDTGDDAR